MLQILAGLVSSLKTSVSNVSKLAISVGQNSKLQISELSVKTKTALGLVVKNTKAVLDTKRTISVISSRSKLVAQYTLGIYFNKLKISAIAVTNIVSSIGYKSKTVFNSVLQTSKLKLDLLTKPAKLTLITHNTVLDLAYVARTKVAFAVSNFFEIFGRVFDDQLTVVEAFRLLFSKQQTDQVAITELITTLSSYNRNITDTGSISDTLQLVLSKTASETVSITEVVTTIRGYSRLITDLVNVTDDFDGISFIDDDQTASIGKNLDETVGLLETIIPVASYVRVNNDSLSLAESVSVVSSYNRNITDVILSLDSTRFDVTKNIIDSATISEDLVTISGYNRSVTDVIGLTENIATVSSYSRLLTDGGTVLDNTQISITKIADDSVSLLDTTIVSIGFGQTITDSTATIDFTFNNIFKVIDGPQNYVEANYLLEDYIVPSDTDVVSVSDNLSLLNQKLITESLTTTDLVTTVSGSDRTILDSSTLTDNIRFNVGTILQETVNIPDLVNIGLTKTFIETFSVADLVTLTGDYSRLITDSLIATDDFDGLATLDDDQVSSVGKNLLDSIATADVVITANGYFRSVLDTVSLTDLTTTTTGYNRIVSDSVGTADQIVTINNYNRSLTDVTAISETITITSAYARSVTDSITTTDQVLLVNSYDRIATDSTAVTDSSSLLFNKLNTDSTSTIDQITLVNTYNRSVTDVSTLTEQVVTVNGYNRSVTDVATLTENVITNNSYNRDLLDNLTAADQTTLVSSYSRLITDTAALSDLVNTLLVTIFLQQDTVPITDQITKVLNKNLTENTIVTDSSTLAVTKNLTESTTISGLITIVSQNYFLQDYVDIGYTGSTILQEAG